MICRDRCTRCQSVNLASFNATHCMCRLFATVQRKKKERRNGVVKVT